MSEAKLKSLIEGLITEDVLIQVVLSSPRIKDSPQKIAVRPIKIKGQKIYQLSLHYAQKVMHENIAPDQLTEVLMQRLLNFKQALFCASNVNYQVLLNKEGKATILQKPASHAPLKVLSHNRQKNYRLQEGKPIPFLVELGVMSPTGKVHADKRDKFRQINRFLEMVEDTLPHLALDKPLRIIDFGCGKAYLTFALYHFLHVEKKCELEIIGLDLKADVVAFCQNVADKLQFTHLRFLQGDIQAYSNTEAVDMVVCLHACDIATDAALEKAVDWKAKVIMAVPCCQHELYNQVKCEELNSLLTHGILKERFAALATDAARAQVLEILGYSTQILEFIDLEHTPKNLLIRAIYQPNKKNREKSIENYKKFKQLLNIKPKIDNLLNKNTV